MATPRRIIEFERQLGLPHNVKGLGRTGHKLIASQVALSLADL